MKRYYLIVLFSMISMAARPQEVVYQDTFDQDTESWYKASDYGYLEFEAGNMVLKGYLKKEFVLSVTSVLIHPDKKYSITTNLKCDGKSTKNAFGLFVLDNHMTMKPVWYYFSIFPKDYYRIAMSTSDYMYDALEDLLPKQKDPAIRINTEGVYNKLELKNDNGVLEFYINDRKVWSYKNPGICPTAVGFFSEGYQEVHVNDIVIRQDGWKKINLVEDAGKEYLKENLGKNVNSENTEILPVISADGQTLYLCVEGDETNAGSDDRQDIWYATLNPDGSWAPRINIGYPLNNDSPNGLNYVSPDNNSLFLSGEYDKDGSSIGGGISFSYREKDGWSLPELITIEDYYTYNKFFGGMTVSPTGKLIIVSLERDDSYGDLDLYISFRQDDDTWSAPLNMGDVINTFGTDGTPFLAADNTTLYYATDAYPGFGNMDIFMTRRLDDTWTNWSKPQNMGPSINTPGWDAYFTIPASGEYSYLVSSDNSLGNEDIFRIRVAEAAKPIPVALVKGQVFNQKTKAFLEATITYYDLESNEEIGIARSNPADGRYTISLPSGHKYSYFAQKENFFSVSENVDLTGLEEYTELIRDLYLAPIEVGESIRLNNIFFDYDKSDLLEGSYFELDRLVNIMNENPNMVIKIKGHTDNMGSDSYNQKLSEERAKAVVTYL
ncbi:MAG: OmpA family protein, partial [Bacteroidales bacterium]|nr:OmpA family protein [Bacteroidales bacterium]